MNNVKEHFKQVMRDSITSESMLPRTNGVLTRRDIEGLIYHVNTPLDFDKRLKLLKEVVKEEKKRGLLVQKGLGINAVYYFQIGRYNEMVNQQRQSVEQRVTVALENYIIKKRKLTMKELMKYAGSLDGVGGYNGGLLLSVQVVKNARNRGFVYLEENGKNPIIHYRG